jgi:ferredoxin
VVIFLAVTLLSLRVYDLFINERKEALLRAERATEQSRSLAAAAQQIREQPDSAGRIGKAELDAAVSPHEKVRIYVEFATSDEGYLSRQNTASLGSFQQQDNAAAEREYASNVWLMTKHILYRAWMALTGVTESDEDRVSFLTANTQAYPDAERSMFEQALVAAQACENRNIACKAACKGSTTTVQAVRCVGACGRCSTEWEAASTGWASLHPSYKGGVPQIPANEASAIATIGEVNEAEMIYASEHRNLGFSTDIVTVGSMLHENSDLAIARSKSGYAFTYTAGEQLNHAIRSYTIVAPPNQAGRTGHRSFYSDETGDIHYNDDGPADASSPTFGH